MDSMKKQKTTLLLIIICSYILVFTGCLDTEPAEEGSNTPINTIDYTGDHTDQIDDGNNDRVSHNISENIAGVALWLSFNLSNAKSLIATQNIAGNSKQKARARQDGQEIPTLIFRKPATQKEAQSRRPKRQTVGMLEDGNQTDGSVDNAPTDSTDADRTVSSTDIDSEEEDTGGANLIAIDENGVASVALQSLEELSVMYTVLSKDQKKVFVVLDPDLMRDAQNTVGGTNCMMFAVDLETNEYTCLDEGYAPQKMDNDFRQTISSSSVKPIQMDEEGNIYYLGRPFNVEEQSWCDEWDNQGNCVNEEVYGYWVNFDWSTEPVIRKIPVQKDEDGKLLYDEDGYLLYGESVALTPDNSYIESFLVSKNGLLVYTYNDWENGDYGIRMYADGSTNNLTDDTSGWWGEMFYMIGDAGTVIFGSGANDWGNEGVKFAQKHPVIPGARVVYKLDTSLFTSRNASPTPNRIIMGDEGYIYALFTEDSYSCDNSGICTNQYRINLYRILPYKQTPIVTIESEGDWWNAMNGFDVQISKGFAYYVQLDEHPQGYYSDRDVIKITKLTTGETITLLNATHIDQGYRIWDDRYDLYTWKLEGTKIHFSGFDNNESQVVTGEIDITKLRLGLPALSDDGDCYLTIQAAASALGESARIRDMEVLIPEQLGDEVSAPRITKIYTYPENLYSVSIDFCKYMNREDVNSKVSILDTSQEEDWAHHPRSMKIWSYKTLHLIIDNVVLNENGEEVPNATTDPLNPDTIYKVLVDASAYDNTGVQLDIAEAPVFLSTTFKTIPAHGWYQSTAIALDEFSDGSVGKYVKDEETDTNFDFYRLIGRRNDDGSWTGVQKQNLKIEIAFQKLNDSWDNLMTLRLNDAKMIDWSNVDWSQTSITDSENYTWEWVDGHREDVNFNEYYWFNIDNCGEGVKGIYDHQNGKVYFWKDGHDEDINGNTYYWFWNSINETSGYHIYDADGQDDGTLLSTVTWEEGYYTDEEGTHYIWSFGEYRDPDNPENIVDWDNGIVYTWNDGGYVDENGDDFEMSALEWVSGEYEATDDTSISDTQFYSMTWVDGYYEQYDSSGDVTGTQTDYWGGVNSPWENSISANQMIENNKKDNWDCRLWRLEFNSGGNIYGEYRTDDSQNYINDSDYPGINPKEWMKLVISAYDATLRAEIINEDGDIINSFKKTDYNNQSQTNSGYYFLDLNTGYSDMIVDNITVTELDANGDPLGVLYEETFSSSAFDTTTFTAPGTYGSDW
ncbi:MAG: hypothetical protein ACMUJM_13315 [bacterium]